MEEKGLRVNTGKTKIMIYGTGLDILQSSGEFPCAVWSGQQRHLLQWLQALGAQEMQWAQGLDKGLIIDIHGARELGWQTTEGSPSRTRQAGGGSFLLLPRRHALSSWWLCIFNHNTCENHLEEVQGAAISSLFPPPLFQDTWLRVQLLCAERNAPC